MQILIDYLTMTSKIHSLQEIMDMLGVHGVEFEHIRSFLGYRNCLYYDGIRLHWTDTDDLYEVCVDLSGKGCRTLEFLSEMKFDWLAYFKRFAEDFQSGDVNISRLDVACDDFEGFLQYARCVKYVEQRKYVCKSKLEPWWTGGRKSVLYFGSEQSDRIIRIYDKLKEQRSKGNIMELPPHWMRCEMQMRDDAALSFILNWYQCPLLVALQVVFLMIIFGSSRLRLML